MKKLQALPSILVFLATWNFGFAQPNFPDHGELYRDDVVPRIDIMINPDTLEWIYENVESDVEFHATFVFDNGTVLDTVDEVGFRLRGNTSRYSKKKSFKVSFNTFHPGREYLGVEKLNLNGEHNDPSIIRSKLCWDLLRKMDIPAPYANHVEVYINGDYYGLYISVEHIDEEFIKSRFGNDDGHLYRCLWPADLAYLGDDPDNYKLMAGDRRVYDLTINEEDDNYTDLRDFIKVLHDTPVDEFKCRLEELFNVYDYLKIMALDIMTSDWDGYIFNKNNFYLYHNSATGKFEYIPYDLDNTFGIDWFNIDWGDRNIYQWGPGESRPLFDRIMENQEFRDQYSYYVRMIIEELFDEEIFFPEIDQARMKISPFVIDDPYYPQDYGYTYTDFLNSYNIALGDHVKYGLKPFLQTRSQSATGQLVANNIKPVIKYILYRDHILNEPVSFRAFVEDDQGDPDVSVLYSIDDGVVQILSLYDDGSHGDREAGDQFFGNSLAGLQEPASILFQVHAEDGDGLENIIPCEPYLINVTEYQSPLLYINEFMASNNLTISDEEGEYDDWIEIYNGDTKPVWLGDKFLSDDQWDPSQWQLPIIYLQPGAFALIWADNSPGQGIYHANFKLDKDRDSIFLFDAAYAGYPLIDSVTFGLQETDISYGRVTDGTPEWKFFDMPTPGVTNSSSGVYGPDYVADLLVYPNPCSGRILFFNEINDISVFDVFGRCVRKQYQADRVDVEGLPPGLYFLRTSKGIVRGFIIQE
jgi:spore coat protein CotH